MPLNVEVHRDGKPRTDIVWDYRSLSMIYTAAMKEGDPNYEYQKNKTFGSLEGGQWVDFSMTPIYYMKSKAGLIKNGRQKLKKTHTFDTLTLEAGDEIRAWRSHK